jgi:hypothetical protein
MHTHQVQTAVSCSAKAQLTHHETGPKLTVHGGCNVGLAATQLLQLALGLRTQCQVLVTFCHLVNAGARGCAGVIACSGFVAQGQQLQASATDLQAERHV